MTEERLAQALAAFEAYKERKKDIIDNNLPLPGIKAQKYYYPLKKKQRKHKEQKLCPQERN